MLDLCPRFILRRIKVANPKYFAHCFTLIGIACAAYIYLLFDWSGAGAGVALSSLFGRIRSLNHWGYRCPLCGGTRAFIHMFSGNIVDALHHSIFGTLLFFYLYLSLPLRCAIAFGCQIRGGTALIRVDAWVENNLLWLIFTAALIQFVLDYAGLFRWTA